MRSLSLAPLLLVLGLPLLIAACNDSVELVPDGAADAAATDVDGAPADVADGAPDQRADAPPDQRVDSAPACVCRFVQCRTNAECQSAIGAASTCDNPGTLSCSGSVGSCRRASDCGGGAGGWACTTGAASLTACP